MIDAHLEPLATIAGRTPPSRWRRVGEVGATLAHSSVVHAILATLCAALLGLVGGASHAADILSVLDDSQQHRLVAIGKPARDAGREARVRASFERLRTAIKPPMAIEFRVISGTVVAETLLGRVLVANEMLADVDEGERLFILAHEIGHVVQEHWRKLGRLYHAHVPGEVRKELTDAVAPVLGREASAMAHAHELEADAFALQVIQRLGFGAESAMAVFLRQGVQHDTATHPGTRKRVAQMRMMMAAAAN